MKSKHRRRRHMHVHPKDPVKTRLVLLVAAVLLVLVWRAFFS